MLELPQEFHLPILIENIFLYSSWPSYHFRSDLNAQRCIWPPKNLISQVDACFSFNKTHQTRNFALFEMVMTQILHQKIFTKFFENKFG